MPDTKTLELVRSTLPAIAAAGPAVTKHFYQRMLSHNPELKNVFNLTNQVNGRQPEALFAALCAYGSHLDNPAALLPAVEKIAQKHVSLSITPEQYAIVGEHLLGTIRELLNPGEEVINAWAEVYGVLAGIFINREEQIYQAHEHQPGGWRNTRRFIISEITKQSDVIKSFVLTPEDALPVAGYLPGQYLSIYLQPEGSPYRQIRQYSLTRNANGRDYRIAVRHQEGGTISGWLHQQAKCGDLLEVAVPGGDFSLDESLTPAPLTLISAGVGQTPLLAMLHQLAEQHYPAEVNWWHATHSSATHAFADEVTELGNQLEKFSQLIWYSAPQTGDNPASQFSGRMAVSMAGAEQFSPQHHFYLCGPLAFMQSVFEQLTAAGIAPDHIHYEMFGPHKSL